jgi:hypothetical protein
MTINWHKLSTKRPKNPSISFGTNQPPKRPGRLAAVVDMPM